MTQGDRGSDETFCTFPPEAKARPEGVTIGCVGGGFAEARGGWDGESEKDGWGPEYEVDDGEGGVKGCDEEAKRGEGRRVACGLEYAGWRCEEGLLFAPLQGLGQPQPMQAMFRLFMRVRQYDVENIKEGALRTATE